MIIKTRIFELIDGKYKNLSELANVMGISVSQIYRVKEGKRNINQIFIIGAIKAFPEYNLDDLFYLTLELPIFEQTMGIRRQVVEKSASAVDEYVQELESHSSAVIGIS